MEIFCMGCSPDSSFPVRGYGGSESNLSWTKVLDTFVQNPDDRRRGICRYFERESSLASWRSGIAPPAGHSLDQAERNQTEPEVHHQPKIDLKGHVARPERQILHQ